MYEKYLGDDATENNYIQRHYHTELIRRYNMTSFTQKGDFSKTTRFLERAKKAIKISDLDKFGKEGVALLNSATPVDSGLTASSWYYKIENKKGSVSISFFNSNIQNGVLVAIILQYGHGTRNGGYVNGKDYINPALKPLFDRISDRAWQEVIKS